MNDADDQQRLSVAKWALFLFVSGVLAPFVLILLVLAFSGAKRPWEAVHQALPFAVALGLLAEVLALVLGLVGRRYVAGKIAWIGSTAVVGLALVVVTLFIPRPVPRPPGGSIPWREPARSTGVKVPADVKAPEAPTTFPAGVKEAVKRQGN